MEQNALTNKHLVNALAKELVAQQQEPVRGGLYWETQIVFAYNSNHMEGCQLTEDQTRSLYETRRVKGVVDIDDVVEANNHFLMFDFMLNTLDEPLTKDLILRLNGILRDPSLGGLEDHTNPGSFKSVPNGIGGFNATPPHMVNEAIDRLLHLYNGAPSYGYEQIAAFHLRFEHIHPFDDGNGRVGRILMFRECLVHGLMPPLIPDADKEDYYQALKDSTRQVDPLVSFLEKEAHQYHSAVERLIPLERLDMTDRYYSFDDPTREEGWIDELLQKAKASESSNKRPNMRKEVHDAITLASAGQLEDTYFQKEYEEQDF